jgi:RNA polymerase sigma factor (sigma-70 family)
MNDDAKLMRLVARGQNDALTDLIDRWRHRVWTFIDRMCGYLGRTDDIFQDVWMRIYLYRKNYDPGRNKSFKAYLFTVVVNCCRTNMAKHMTRSGTPVTPIEANDADSPSSAPAPLDALIKNEQNHQVRQAIGRLPEKQRTVVLLYLLYDSDYSLIAEALGLRNGTVRSHMSLALKNLRRCLVRKSPDTEPAPQGQVNYE